MTDGERTGIPGVDALIDIADRERDEYWSLAAVSDAERTVARARQDELVDQQNAANRRLSAAEGRLTRAKKVGDPAKIVAARERYDAAYSEFQAISDAVIAEMHGIVGAGLERSGQMLEQMRRTWSAGDAVIDALAAPHPVRTGRDRELMSATGSRRVCLVSGFTPAGRGKHRACCTCGYRTTARVSQARALAALLAEHEQSDAVCALCGTDYRDRAGDRLAWRSHLDLVDDPAGGVFLACRGMPRACRDGAAQAQLHLDRAAFDSFGLDLPGPRLRLVADQEGSA